MAWPEALLAYRAADNFQGAALVAQDRTLLRLAAAWPFVKRKKVGDHPKHSTLVFGKRSRRQGKELPGYYVSVGAFRRAAPVTGNVHGTNGLKLPFPR